MQIVYAVYDEEKDQQDFVREATLDLGGGESLLNKTTTNNLLCWLGKKVYLPDSNCVS